MTHTYSYDILFIADDDIVELEHVGVVYMDDEGDDEDLDAFATVLDLVAEHIERNEFCPESNTGWCVTVDIGNNRRYVIDRRLVPRTDNSNPYTCPRT